MARQGRVPEGFPPGFDRPGQAGTPLYRHVVATNRREALRERERELGTLRDGLERASAGEGALILVEGPAGVGKTELAREARKAAEQMGVTPLEATGSELERPFAFGVVRQLLEPIVSGGSGPTEVFAGAAAPASRLF